jgi:membrane associated rhomboid family serine protease
MQIFSAASHDEVITHIGYWAHIGGFAAGVILARALLAIGLVTAYGEEMART